MTKIPSTGMYRTPECQSRGRLFRPSNRPCRFADRTRRPAELRFPPDPGPGAGTLMEPGPTPVLWGSLQDAHCPSPKVFSTLGVGFSRLGGWGLLPLHIPEEGAGSEGRSLGPVTED